MKATETEIQRFILDELVRRGIVAWRNQAIPVPIRRGRQIVGLRKADPHTVGMPDIFCLRKCDCCGRGMLIGIEVKTETGRQRPEQKAWQERMNAVGATYVLARSWDDVAEALDLA